MSFSKREFQEQPEREQETLPSALTSVRDVTQEMSEIENLKEIDFEILGAWIRKLHIVASKIELAMQYKHAEIYC